MVYIPSSRPKDIKHIIGVSKGGERETERQKIIFDEIMAENLLNLMKDMSLPI